MDIDSNNYEEYALDYLEGNLDAASRERFEHFLRENPQLAGDVLLLGEGGIPTLEPDVKLVYPDKALLLRRRRPVRMYLRTAAVAASVLAMVGGYLFLRLPSLEPVAEPFAQSETSIGQDPTLPADSLQNNLADLPESRPEAIPAESEMEEIREAVASVVIPVSEPRKKEKEEGKETVEKEDLIIFEDLSSDGEVETYTREVIVLDEGDELMHFAVVVEEHSIVDPPEREVQTVEEPIQPDAEEEQVESEKILPGGLRRLAAALSRISPISTYEDENVKITEFASIPVSKKYKQ